MDNELLRSIEQKLDAGDLNSAQKMLATADPFYTHGTAVSYLTTRLLYLRSRITEQEAVQRLRDLRSSVEHFPELDRLIAELDPKPEPSDAPPPPVSAPLVVEPTRYPSQQPLPESPDSALPLPAIETTSSPTNKIPPTPDSVLSAPSEPRDEVVVVPPDVPPPEPQISSLSEPPPAAPISMRASLRPGRPTLDISNLSLDSKKPSVPPSKAETVPPSVPRLSESPAPQSVARVSEAPPSSVARLSDAVPPPSAAPVPLAKLSLRSQPPLSEPLSDPQSWDTKKSDEADMLRPEPGKPAPVSKKPAAGSIKPAPVSARGAVTLSEAPTLKPPSESIKPAPTSTRNSTPSDEAETLKPGPASGKRAPAAADAFTNVPESEIPTVPITLPPPEPMAPRRSEPSVRGQSSMPPRTRPRPSIKPSLPTSMQLGNDADALLVMGNGDEALRLIEEQAQVRLALQPGGPSETNPKVLAQLAAKFFTTAPALRDFAPYDLSLWSIPRLDAALDLILGEAPLKLPTDTHHPILRFLGSYVGETLRHTHQGEWAGDFSDPENAHVIVGAHVLHPFQLISERWKQGATARIKSNVRSALGNRNSPTWQRSQPCPIDPPMPWPSQQEWPEISALPELAITLSHSVIALYCQSSGGLRLDGSPASVAALDSYLNLIAPTSFEGAATSGWARRVSALVGAYVGQVLCRSATGVWEQDASATAPHRFSIALAKHRVTHPLEVVLERLSKGPRRRLSEYVRELTA
jgi:hypothetical protein